MKFSLNLARYYNEIHASAPDPFAYGTDEIVKRIGLQLGAVEGVEDGMHTYDGIVVVRIVQCEKHPDADKLSVCMIDDGGVTENVERDAAGLVQVVCGAPNARSGMLAAWIPPTATVPSTINKPGTEPFVLEARELRGVVSNGMLASTSELGINDNHDGILDIPESDLAEPIDLGQSLASVYNLSDYIIDCENKMFTHRPDCFGNIGISRELAGIFGDQYTSPEWYKSATDHDVTSDLPINVSNESDDKVSRFMVQSMSDVSVGPAPLWLQAYLQRIDSNSINNIVDYTNYFMMLTGQPLHAYDYDKVLARSDTDNPSVVVRYAKDGEKLALLNGKTIQMTTDDIVIATDNEAIGLAGVMGGADTEVDESTKNIIIECGTFDMYAVRRMSMRHGLFTDAVTRFNKGQSPLQNDKVLAKIVDEIKQDGAQVASPAYDLTTFDTNADNLNKVEVSADFINSRLGTDLDVETIKVLLENVEFTVSETDSNSSQQDLVVTAPFWRMDISIKEDIVEEVGRLHGYHNVPVVLPGRSSKAAPVNSSLAFKQQLRNTLVKAGANELLTYSFVHGDLMRNTGTNPEKWAYHLRNALSPDLQYYRTSIVPSLLTKVHSNIKAGAGSDTNEFALFEIGKAHVKGHNEEDETTLPKQMRRLALVVAADPKTAKKHRSDAYYLAKKYLDLIIGNQADYVSLDTNEYPLTAPYQIGRSAAVLAPNTEKPFAVVGEFNRKTKKALKLPEYCAGFEIDIDLLQAAWASSEYQIMSQYPESTQDVTYEVPAETEWASLFKMLQADLHAQATASGAQASITPLDIYQQDDSDKKRMSFRVSVRHHDMTLRSAEVTRILDLVTSSLQEKLDVVRI